MRRRRKRNPMYVAAQFLSLSRPLKTSRPRSCSLSALESLFVLHSWRSHKITMRRRSKGDSMCVAVRHLSLSSLFKAVLPVLPCLRS